MSGSGLDGPPPYRLRYDGHELVLRPYSWCYRNGCVDGFPENPPSVGSPKAIWVQVPLDGWHVSASYTPSSERCGRRQSVTPTRVGDWYVLEPAGYAGRYDVDLFAQGSDGDVAAQFQWNTPADGPLPNPYATLALIADNDGQPDSYGVELTLENLAETPAAATAQITVTAANGESLSFSATHSQQGCRAEGMVYFDGPDTAGLAAAALGDLPFRYTVNVTLDGRTYRASAGYPADEIRGNEPSVALDFSPPLPALR